MKKFAVTVYEKNFDRIGKYLVPARNRKDARDWAILLYAKRSLMEDLHTVVEFAWGQ